MQYKKDEKGNFMVRKHTIDVPPGKKRRYRVTADALVSRE